MKKLFIFFSIFAVSFVFYHVYIWGNYGNGYYIIQPNRTILQNKDDNNFFISDILDIKNTKQHLIALRMPESFYKCNNKNTVTCNPIITYIIIDKESHKMNETDNYIHFLNKLKYFKIDVTFNENEINTAKAYISRNIHICEKNEQIKTCKLQYSYSINVF